MYATVKLPPLVPVRRSTFHDVEIAREKVVLKPRGDSARKCDDITDSCGKKYEEVHKSNFYKCLQPLNLRSEYESHHDNNNYTPTHNSSPTRRTRNQEIDASESACDPSTDNDTTNAEKMQMKCKKNGIGMVHYSNGDMYEGYFQNGKKNGRGIYRSANGHVYDGNWSEGKQNGQGKLFYTNGDVYSGNWVNGKKNGEGCISYANGDSFRGLFENGVRHGPGTFTSSEGEIYTGFYINNMKNGMSQVKYTNGDIYEGEFENNMISGHGRLLYGNGDIYIGEYVNDHKEGNGVYKHKRGDVYHGQWKNGRMHGIGKFSYATGEVYEGEFENDTRKDLGKSYQATYSIKIENEFRQNVEEQLKSRVCSGRFEGSLRYFKNRYVLKGASRYQIS
eukprot:gene142-234_t